MAGPCRSMLITIGKVLKPWGVKGEVKVQPLSDVAGRFTGLRRVVLVSPRGKEMTCLVRSVRYRGDAPYLLLEGYDSPERSRDLANWLVTVPREEAAPLPEGRYYWFELIGMTVLSEDGETLGEITDVFATGSNDVYIMKGKGGEVYLPATREIVKAIDRGSRTMTIHVVDGLLD